jgi:tetratricopeptide (TPR) repeat protein
LISAQPNINFENCLDEAMAYVQVGNKLSNNGQFDESIEYFEKAVETFDYCGDEQNKARALSKLGFIYLKKNEPEQALTYIQESYNIYQKDNEIDEGEIETINNFGTICVTLGDLDKAIELFQIVLSWSEENNNTYIKAISSANIGLYYQETKNYSNAIKYHLQAAELFNIIDEFEDEGYEFINVGDAYYSLYNFEVSLIYYDKAELNCYKIRNNNNLLFQVFSSKVLTYNSIATNYKKNDDFNNSIKYFELSLNESIKAQNIDNYGYFLTVNTLIELGDIYSIQGNHKKAIDAFNESLFYLENYNSYFANGSDAFLRAKILFEQASIESEELNYVEAVSLFNDSAEKIKSLIQEEMYYQDRLLLEGYYHYSISKKNYFLFKHSGNIGNKELAEDELLTSIDKFNDYGSPELARLAISDKLVSYPYSQILYDEYMLLLNGLKITGLNYPTNLETSEISNIKFNYQYFLRIPSKGLPRIRFCVEDYCSEWIKISDNEIMETTIKVKSDIPTKINSDILIYVEKNPDISLGNIGDYYYQGILLDNIEFKNNTIFVSYKEAKPYETVNIVIEEPIIDRIKNKIDWYFAIIGISIMGLIKYLKSHFKSKPKSKKKNKK